MTSEIPEFTSGTSSAASTHCTFCSVALSPLSRGKAGGEISKDIGLLFTHRLVSRKSNERV